MSRRSCSHITFSDQSRHMILCVGMVTAEGGSDVRKMTFCQLREEVARYRAAMKAVGIQANDRVVGELLMSIIMSPQPFICHKPSQPHRIKKWFTYTCIIYRYLHYIFI